MIELYCSLIPDAAWVDVTRWHENPWVWAVTFTVLEPRSSWSG